MSSSRVLVSLRVGASQQRAFDAFTRQIGEWWRPNDLFRVSDRTGCRLAFEPDPPERLVEVAEDGERFLVGEVHRWEPPSQLAFEWRQSSFAPDQRTEVVVTFDPVDTGTRVTVEHFGWDSIPQNHAGRHGFPLVATQQRQAEWWRMLLQNFSQVLG